MKVKPIGFNRCAGKFVEKMSEHGGEKLANYVNAGGKMVVAPLVIMNNPFTNESKKNRKWASTKQIVEAVITLGIQLAGLGVLYKKIDKLASKGKINFKLTEIAKEKGIFPEKIQEEIRAGLSKKEAIKKLDEQCLSVFKDRLGTLTTIALYIPTLAISNKVFPVIAERMTKNENK